MRNRKSVLTDIVAYRRSRGETQTEFWTRFGVTQSGGSRYESGRDLPRPVALLILAFAEGSLSDKQLITLGSAARRIGENNERK